MLAGQPLFAEMEHIAIAKIGEELVQGMAGLHDGFDKNIHSTKGDQYEKF
jgi:hypothetical protein